VLINETCIAVCAECRLILLRRKICCPPYRFVRHRFRITIGDRSAPFCGSETNP
jgi:hypothetical protein